MSARSIIMAAAWNTFNPFTIFTTNTIGTNFSPYPIGPPQDWILRTGTNSLSIESGGQYGNKLVVNETSGSAGFKQINWTSSRLSATDDQEILMLVKVIAAPSTFTLHFGPLLKSSPTNFWFQHVGLISDRGTSARYNAFTTGITGSGSPSWSLNTLYWIRMRNHTVNTSSRKVWAFGGSEPASFTNLAVAADTWTTASGYAGVGSNSTSPDSRISEVHFVSVGYNFVSAPFPP